MDGVDVSVVLRGDIRGRDSNCLTTGSPQQWPEFFVWREEEGQEGGKRIKQLWNRTYLLLP